MGTVIGIAAATYLPDTTVPAVTPRVVPPMMRHILPTAAEIASARHRLHLKAVSIVVMLAAGYWGLVFAPFGVLGRVVAAVTLIHACIAVATNIMHDANHSAFSTSRRANQALSYAGDLLGSSSYLWRIQHNDLHHRHTNVMGYDADIEQAPLARLAPEQQWRRWHRGQHIYMWPLYGFLTVKSLFVSDFQCLKSKRIGSQPLPRPVGASDGCKLVAGKLVNVAWALVIPMMFHPWWKVVVVYFVCAWCVGFSLAVIFQLAHCVDNADFFADDGLSLKGDANVRHQLATTVDIASSNRLTAGYIGWLMGGLDHQVEHHLAPRLPHTMYPQLAVRVDAMCAAHGLTRRIHTGVFAALASHGRWLKQMGTRPPIPAQW